jgi:hypothetical protein
MRFRVEYPVDIEAESEEEAVAWWRDQIARDRGTSYRVAIFEARAVELGHPGVRHVWSRPAKPCERQQRARGGN